MTPTEILYFDAFAWVRRYYPSIDKSQIDAVLSFSLIWNLFEARVCDKFVTVGKIEKKVEVAVRSGRLPERSYEDYFVYFRDHYGSEGGRQALDTLAPIDFNLPKHVREGNERVRGELERVFGTENPSERDKVYASLLIAYRIRNNLFHGSKGIQDLPNQVELFHVVNSLLANFVEAFNPPRQS